MVSYIRHVDDMYTLVLQDPSKSVFWAGFYGLNTSSKGIWSTRDTSLTTVHVHISKYTVLRLFTLLVRHKILQYQKHIIDGFQSTIQFETSNCNTGCSLSYQLQILQPDSLLEFEG